MVNSNFFKAQGLELKMDQRDFERYFVETPVLVQYATRRDREKTVFSKSLNISAGGIFLIDGPPLPEGKEIRLEIELPLDLSRLFSRKALLIKATGSVLRSGPDGAAVKFSEAFDVYVVNGQCEQQFLH